MSAGYLAAHGVQNRGGPGAGRAVGAGGVRARPQEAIRLVEGKVPGRRHDHALLVWSYAEHRQLWSRKHGTTGFCVQLISLLDGTPVWISDPLPGSTHDKAAFDTTSTTSIVDEAAAGIGRQGLPGRRPVYANQETSLARTQRRRKDGQRHTVRIPRTRRTTRRALQELANPAH